MVHYYPGFQQTPGMPILLQHSVILHYFAKIFDIYDEAESALIKKFKFSIEFENLGKNGVKSPCVHLAHWPTGSDAPVGYHHPMWLLASVQSKLCCARRGLG